MLPTPSVSQGGAGHSTEPNNSNRPFSMQEVAAAAAEVLPNAAETTVNLSTLNPDVKTIIVKTLLNSQNETLKKWRQDADVLRRSWSQKSWNVSNRPSTEELQRIKDDYRDFPDDIMNRSPTHAWDARADLEQYLVDDKEATERNILRDLEAMRGTDTSLKETVKSVMQELGEEKIAVYSQFPTHMWGDESLLDKLPYNPITVGIEKQREKYGRKGIEPMYLPVRTTERGRRDIEGSRKVGQFSHGADRTKWINPWHGAAYGRAGQPSGSVEDEIAKKRTEREGKKDHWWKKEMQRDDPYTEPPHREI